MIEKVKNSKSEVDGATFWRLVAYIGDGEEGVFPNQRVEIKNI